VRGRPAPEHFYDNTYAWKLTGTQLTVSTIANECGDQVAETILTGRPWTKTD
jgi:hypothetical protein